MPSREEEEDEDEFDSVSGNLVRQKPSAPEVHNNRSPESHSMGNQLNLFNTFNRRVSSPAEPLSGVNDCGNSRPDFGDSSVDSYLSSLSTFKRMQAPLASPVEKSPSYASEGHYPPPQNTYRTNPLGESDARKRVLAPSISSNYEENPQSGLTDEQDFDVDSYLSNVVTPKYVSPQPKFGNSNQRSSGTLGEDPQEAALKAQSSSPSAPADVRGSLLCHASSDENADVKKRSVTDIMKLIKGRKAPMESASQRQNQVRLDQDSALSDPMISRLYADVNETGDVNGTGNP